MILRRVALLLGCAVALNATAQGLFDDNEARRRIDLLSQQVTENQRLVAEQLKKLDAAMSQAVRSTIAPGAAVATISMNLNYLAPAHGELTCKGAVVRGGKSVAFAEAEVTDAKGNAVCRGSATFRIMLPRN